MNADAQTGADRCPCCGAEVKHYPDQDGACDRQCTLCGWSEHVPGSSDISAALTLHREGKARSEPTAEYPLLSAGEVDLGLLKQQAAILGKVVDERPLTDDERACLQGLWEFVHRLVDRLERGSESGHTLRQDEGSPGRPTVVVWVEGGLVQGVEADAPACVLVCDFDCPDEGAPLVGGRPCAVSEWCPVAQPGQDFGRVLEALRSGSGPDP